MSNERENDATPFVTQTYFDLYDRSFSLYKSHIYEKYNQSAASTAVITAAGNKYQKLILPFNSMMHSF